MPIKVKISCPLCEFVHYVGHPGKLKLVDTASLPDMCLSNTKIGGGKVDVYEVSFEDFPNRTSTNLEDVEIEILKNYLERSEKLCRILELRLAEL